MVEGRGDENASGVPSVHEVFVRHASQDRALEAIRMSGNAKALIRRVLFPVMVLIAVGGLWTKCP